MIDLRSQLGRPPTAYPGAPIVSPGMPGGIPTGAPIQPMTMVAQREAQSLGCVGCAKLGDATVATLSSGWWASRPRWMQLAMILAGSLAVGAIGAGIYFKMR